jgi:hypothetical protein
MSASVLVSGSMAKLPRPRRRRPRVPISRIKAGCTYDTNDIAKLLGVHRNTVRHWLKQGLATIDDRRPLLVHGAVLKAFLQARQGARRRKCRPDEFYCFKCREPRGAWGGLADVRLHTENIAKLTALCVVCETQMHRSVRRADLPELANRLELQSKASLRLYSPSEAIENCDFEEDLAHVETEPAE